MIGTVIVAAIIALLVGLLGTLIALKIHYRYLQSIQAQRTAWEHAQESAQRNWEIKQEKRALEMEAKLTARIQQVENDWNAWKQKIAELAQTVTQQHAEIATFLHIERELARIPLVEEMPIAFDARGESLLTSSRWNPLSLGRVDLSERDLSRRYLGQANLHEARLRGTNFFMADLSGADLSGADLSGADLTGANLSHADLHNAILLNTNLQVADIHNAILFGANLHGARNLSRQQIDTAIYDATSQFDADFDLTIPRLHSINPNMISSTSSVPTPFRRPVQSALSDRPTRADIAAGKAKQQTTAGKASGVADYMEAEIPDLDVSPTPIASKQTPLSPALTASDEIIEGEITEISASVTSEVEAIPASSLDEPADAEIREINDAENCETCQPDETHTMSEIEEIGATDGSGYPAANEIDSADKNSTVITGDATSEAELGESINSESTLEHAEETDSPAITSLATPESFEPPTPESELSVAESELFTPESELHVSESETSNEMPSSGTGIFETEAPLETSPAEPDFLQRASEQSTNGNGYGNGGKRGTPAGVTMQKGKNNNRRRPRTR